MTEVGDEVGWPPTYIDPQTGISHDWDDEMSPDVNAYDDGAVGAYTYRDLAYDRADAAGMDIDEYLDHLAFRHGEGYDEKMSPDYVDDGDGYG